MGLALFGSVGCGTGPREDATEQLASGRTAITSANLPEAADLCGTWPSVELAVTTRTGRGVVADQHVFCRPIQVLVPAELAVSGNPAKGFANLSFRSFDGPGSSRDVTCKYKPDGAATAHATYRLSSCNKGMKAGSAITAQKFVLETERNSVGDFSVQIALNDGSAPPANAYREILGLGPRLDGVKLRIRPGAVPPFSGTGLADGPPIFHGSFVANEPPGSVAVGASVQVTGTGAFGDGVELIVPYDSDLIDSLPSGTRSTLHVEKIDQFYGPVDADVPAFSGTPVERGVVVDPTPSTIQVGLNAPGAYVTVVTDLTPLARGTGPVMNEGVKVYLLWVGNFDTKPEVDPRAAIRQFIRDVGASSWYEIARTYDIANRTVELAGEVQYTDVDLPLTNTTVYTKVVQRAIDEQAVPDETNALYLVLGAPGVDERNDNGTARFCGGGMCGFHSYRAVSEGRTRKYAFIGHPSTCVPIVGHACDPTWYVGSSVTPHPLEVDGMISIVAHELVEAVTDPEVNGWVGFGSVENADKCAWQFPSRSLDGSSTPSVVSNLDVGGNKYFIQANWVNQEGGYCAMAVENIALSVTPPTDALVLNQVGHFTVHVLNEGPNILDARAFRIRASVDSYPVEGSPLPVEVPVSIAPGQTVDVDVPVHAPIAIDGNVAPVTFRFEMFEPRNNIHAFPDQATVTLDVQRAEVLRDDAECVEMTIDPYVQPFNSWFPVHVRYKNKGTTQWLRDKYKVVQWPLDQVSAVTTNLPRLLASQIDPEGFLDLTFYAYAQQPAQAFTIETSLATEASAFGARCSASFLLGCPDGSMPQNLYADKDGDGYGAGPLTTACAGPGWVTNADDCCDEDRIVHPGASWYTAVASCGVEWNFACDGATGPEVCDGRDNDKNGFVDDKVGCHNITLMMSNIDDDAWVWQGTSAEGPGYCDVHYDGGPGSGGCWLTGDALDSRAEELTYVVKLGNGGGFTTSGEFDLNIDGNIVHLGSQLPVTADTGWQYRNQFTVNFKYGYLVSSIEDQCNAFADCNY